MKTALWIIVALASAAAGRAQPLAAGLRHYEQAEFGKAAAQFQSICAETAGADACYWTGLAYERLADTRVPFGCHTARKAHDYLRRAADLAPATPKYRDALFDFLLDNADCSRGGLREAVALLSAIPESDPDYDLLRGRLEDAARWSSAADLRLRNLLLAVPRAGYRVSSLAGSFRPSPNRQTAPKPQPRLEAAAPE